MTIFANCKNNNAANGDISMPPKSGTNFRQVSSSGSLKLVKIDDAEPKAPGFIQLSNALAKIAKIKILISNETKSAIESSVSAPMLMVIPLRINTLKLVSICSINTKINDDVSICPIGGTKRRKSRNGGWVILTRNCEIGL